MRRLVIGLVLLGILGAFLGLTLVLGGPVGAVDWRSVRAVAFESDDWGLQGFVPAADSWRNLDREEIGPGRFPPVYWASTLEDSASVARLCVVMQSFTGADGLPAIFQPNYVLSALGWHPAAGGGEWIRYDLPDLDPRYARPGLWDAVAAGRRAGVWYPEFHAAWHYDPDRRRAAGLQPGDAQQATERGIMLFPGSEKARELGPWRSREDLENELDGALRVFGGLFRRSPSSVIAPDYTWNDGIEEMWVGRGLRVIQGKREQRNPDWGSGWQARLNKLWGRSWSRIAHPDRTYLERNCRFEPVQSADTDASVAACVRQTMRAWRRAEPAIVETHRINFAHTDPAVVKRGLAALGDYLAGVTGRPGEEPTFLTDREIAQLQRRGVSWCVRGDRIVLRNASRSRRLVLLPVEAMAKDDRCTGEVCFIALEAGQMRFVKIDDSKS